MSSVVAIHSFRGGTGKSNTTANLAVMLGWNRLIEGRYRRALG
jgi:MinD-like ATPase involved in chromosome partitioning or flagellar assembly